MRTHLTHLGIALLTAALGIACSSTSSNNDRRHRDEAGETRGINDRVALRGCVQPAGQGFALQHVVVVPAPELPAGNEAMEHPLIARGSSVQLAAGTNMTEDFKKYLNNEVAIMGNIVDRGVNPIGTSGQDNPTGGVKIAVEKLNKIADNCVGE